MTVMSQEEMMVGIKTVAQGLEALKNELMASNNSGQSTMQPEEKQSMLQKTLDMTELGLGEAQVKYERDKKYKNYFYNICFYKLYL
jgi:kinesin light chain